MATPRFVICIENSEYRASLELRKIYAVVADAEAEKGGYLRVIDQSGEDYLYPASQFIDAHLSKAVEAAVVNTA